ncbi:DUF3993 domain-containing protein [Bacillus sp. BGMRC 2118]|nr:DUF3993 domain-containing protein [Bacillus sp. BGMRC 2118]
MMKRKYSFVLIILTIIASMFVPKETYAAEKLDIQSIKDLLEKADDAQYSLTEKHYSWEEALKSLTPYMTEQFATDFMNEHLFSEEEGYIYYGTDFSLYHIPHYAFTDKTTVIMSLDETKLYIYELFSGTGPVMFKDQYELVTIVHEDKTWKISNITYVKELPTEVKEGTHIEIREEVDEEKKKSSEEIIVDSNTTISLSPYSKYITVIPYVSIMKHSSAFLAVEGDAKIVSFLALSNVSW